MMRAGDELQLAIESRRRTGAMKQEEEMNGIKWIVSSIALSSLVAACGTMSVGQHWSEAQRYEEAARAARNRGDSTEAMRDEALARKHQADARNQEEREATDLGGAP